MVPKDGQHNVIETLDHYLSQELDMHYYRHLCNRYERYMSLYEL